jgi:hypothetical protein
VAESNAIDAVLRAAGLVAGACWAQVGTDDADAGDDPTTKTVNISTTDPTVATHDAPKLLAFFLVRTTAP